MVLLLLAAHLLGLASSLHALMTVRTAQGTIAWIVSLNTLPLVALPAYWAFGRSKLEGYVVRRRRRDQAADPDARRIADALREFAVDERSIPDGARAAQRLARLPFLRGNRVDLLIDGEATFDSLLAGVEAAERYLLVQFYVLRDDRIGGELRDRLIERARAGVRVRLLYDELGCAELPDAYLDSLSAAGVEVASFGSIRWRWNHLQINFRNHRKVVVADGAVGWVGGLNVGDEYLGRDPDLGPWRDTHLRLAGPSALGLQLSFLEDWNWATGELLDDLAWEPRACGESAVLIAPTGPADRLETAALIYQQAIDSARERIWIASPYFVPDAGVVASLHLAALRGVDVRILVPDRSDNRFVDAAAWPYFEPLTRSGITIHRYRAGTLHSKHFVVDDRAAGVGTANFDNRSFRLNFEITAIVADPAVVARVAEMFERDLDRSHRLTDEDLASRSFLQRAFSRAALLFAPVL